MTYSGKLLLFGEYTAVRGAQSLAVPLDLYQAYWLIAEDEAQIPHPLDEFIAYLEQQAINASLNLSLFKKEVAEGLYFHSSIPVGYGVGSSGALCAAVYERFAFAPIDKQDKDHYPQLKKQLSQLEAYFHGSSSGTDPLICYINQPALLLPNSRINTVTLPANRNQGGHFFLIDTGISRKTAPLVALFLEKCKQPEYTKALSKELIEYNDRAIGYFLNDERDRLMEVMLQISQFQLEYFKEMIPEACLAMWKKGLKNKEYAIKLCGAGGGGFLIGYTQRDFNSLSIENATLLAL